MKSSTFLILAIAAPILALPSGIVPTNTTGLININSNTTNTTLPWLRNATHIAPVTYIPPHYPLNTTTSNTTTSNITTINITTINTTTIPPYPHKNAIKAAATTNSYSAPTCTYRGNAILSTYYLDGLSPNVDVGKLKDRLNRKCGLTRHFLYDVELDSWYRSVGLEVPGDGDDLMWAAEWNHYMATPECVAGVVAEAAGLGTGAKCIRVKGGPVADGDDEHGKRRPGRA